MSEPYAAELLPVEVPVLDDFESEDDDVEDEVELDDFASEPDVDDFEDDAGALLDEEPRLSFR
ncbi:hypothetical protein SAMN04487983_101694 [Streptomyces sp. yr375]|nr:hypothetical protein SAMN04487983_101694 [Streptomyces sp. yr375]